MERGQYIRLISTNQKEIDAFNLEHKFIYRYVPMERLLDILQNENITFVNPQKWNDPFDNLLFRLLTENELKGTFLNSIYCLCFTLTPHSQAFWKTYSPDGFSARLKINTTNFLNILGNLNDKVWLGKMQYILEKDLVKTFQNTKELKASLKLKEPNDTFLKLFHYKRIPFEYENEVRLLIQAEPIKLGVRKVQIKPRVLFEEIRLD